MLQPVQNANEIKAMNMESAIEAASINDTLYAYPLTANNGYFMFYDKSYFSHKDIKTLDSLLDVAAQKNKKVVMDLSSGWYLYSFFGNTGLTLSINDDEITNPCNRNATDTPIKGTAVV